jgi:hypothetical protein
VGWIAGICIGAVLGIIGGLLGHRVNSGPAFYLWFLKFNGVSYLTFLIWDGLSGDKKAQAMLPKLFGMVVIIGITVIIDQLQGIKRHLPADQPRREQDKATEEFYSQVKSLLKANKTKAPADHTS